MRTLRRSPIALCLVMLTLSGCPGGGSSATDGGLDAFAPGADEGPPIDTGPAADLHFLDAAPMDAGAFDASPTDAGSGDLGRLADAAADAAGDAADDMGVVLGACCTIDGRCQLSDADRCASLGGALTANQVCEAVQCAAPTRQQLVEHALELEARVRADLGLYHDIVGTIGREFWNLNGDEPEYTGALLGRGAFAPDSRFVIDTYRGLYRTVRHALQLERMAESADGLTPEERSATVGFAVTIQAYAILLVTNVFGDSGVLPVDALDDLVNAAFLDQEAALAHVAERLDTAAMALTRGGAAFPFGLSYGFDGFDRPASFRQVNRALSARVRMYQGDRAGAISGIAGSFFNINGDFTIGPRHGFSAADRNPLFHAPDVDRYTLHASYARLRVDPRIARRVRAYDAERVGRVPVTHDDLAGSHQLALVPFDTEPWPIIRNAELILLYGEAQAPNDINETLAAINRVRAAGGQGDYRGATDVASLRAEIMSQRRLVFFGEGHRWIDMRRAGRLAELPLDRPRDAVIEFLPRPDAAALRDL